MIFSSATFLLIFLPIGIALSFIPGKKFKNIYILILSLLFYTWGEPKNILLLLLTIAVNYLLSMGISYAKSKMNVSSADNKNSSSAEEKNSASDATSKKNSNHNALSIILVITAIVYNLGILFVYKYLDFAIVNINKVFSSDIPLKNIAFPIGISFFVFKSLSYIFDVNSGKIKHEKNPFYYALYISFFPQVMSGPITRYEDFGPQIAERKVTLEKVYGGIIRFMIGFSKKILLSDLLADTVSTIFTNNGYSAPAAWLGAIAFTLQIYFDFSGYSDMAIGLGMMLGFDTKENFNLPYTAKSIQDFWRRWHISLSSWFRDYVYFPLGGSRCKMPRIILNTTIVFFLTGLWHGANWNFIAWGLFYVIFIVAERLFLKKVFEKIPAVFSHIYALIFIVIGWVFFRAESLGAALTYIKNMFTFNSKSIMDLFFVLDPELICCMVLGIIFSSGFAAWINEKLKKNEIVYNVLVILVFLLAICYMWGNGFSPFLYVQF